MTGTSTIAPILAACCLRHASDAMAVRGQLTYRDCDSRCSVRAAHRYNLDSGLAAPQPLLAAGTGRNELQAAFTKTPDAGQSAIRCAPDAAPHMSRQGIHCVSRSAATAKTCLMQPDTGEDGHGSSVLAESTAALMQYLRQILRTDGALLFEVREHEV